MQKARSWKQKLAILTTAWSRIFCLFAGALFFSGWIAWCSLIMPDRGALKDETSPLLRPSVEIESLPRLKRGQSLDFSNGQNRAALLGGWGAEEPGGVWSEGHRAYVGVALDEAPSNTAEQIIVQIGVWLVPQKKTQRVEIWSNGKKLVQLVLRVPIARIKIPLSKLTRAERSALILGFYFPDAASPKAVGVSSDPRVVVAFLQTVELTR